MNRIDQVVKDEMDGRMANLISLGCPSRAEAARVLLGWYPNWFWQTQEGEYLTMVAKGAAQ